MRAIIVDDEPDGIRTLNKMLAINCKEVEVVAVCTNANEAKQKIKELTPELIFLDIQMPKISGLDFFRSLKQAPPVIFTTAFPQYALDGFELNALDYLVKPVSFERFLKAALKAKEYYEVRQKNLAEAGAQRNDYFFIKADNKLVKLFFDDILYAEALQNYVAIHTVSKKYITYLTFRSIEDYLPSDRFIKTHKSYIVSASRIDNIEGNDIRIGEHHIPISRSTREEVMEKLLKGRFLKR